MKFRTLILLALLLIFPVACRTVDVKPTGRSGADQFLIARTMADAVSLMQPRPELVGTSVTMSVETMGFDSKYLNKLLESWLVASNGAIQATNPAYTFNVMVEAAGSDIHEFRWEIPIPLPSFKDGITLTQLNIYEDLTQVARCHLWGYITDNKTNKTAFTQPPVYVTHHLSNRKFLGFTLGRTSDLKELGGKEEKTNDQLPIVGIKK